MENETNLLYDLAAYLLEPGRKTYFLYLLSAVVIGAGFLAFYRKDGESYGLKLRKYLFNPDHWLHRSAWLDYFLVAVNAATRVFLIVPFFMTGYQLSFEISKWLMLTFDIPLPYEGPKWPVIIGYTFCLWIAGDFSRYLLHYLAHRIPFLWELHKVHHSAEVMNPLTLYRQHPVEMFLFHLRGMLVFACVTAIFYYYFSHVLGIVDVLGINAGRFVFLFLGANLRHSHVPLRYGRFVEHIFISPLQHQIHHSIDPADHHRNMGSHLAIWDWMFGTLKVTEKGKRNYTFGIPDQGYDPNHWLKALWMPIWRGLWGRK